MISKFLLICLTLLFTACSPTKTQPSVNKKCFEKPNKGMCKALFFKYYFDEKDKKCKKFAWGGCGGNVPFHTLEECKTSCEK